MKRASMHLSRQLPTHDAVMSPMCVDDDDFSRPLYS